MPEWSYPENIGSRPNVGLLLAGFVAAIAVQHNGKISSDKRCRYVEPTLQILDHQTRLPYRLTAEILAC